MNLRTTALVAAALLLAPGAIVLNLPQADAATTRTLAITTGSADPQVAFKTFDSVPLKVFDFNGDGQLEIVAQNDNQWVYIFDSKTGAILAEVTTKFPSGWGARSFNGPEAAVMTGNGAPRLIVMNSAAYLTSFRLDTATSTPTKLVLVKEWERRLTDCFSNPGSDSKPTLADLDRDGRLEIVATTEESGIYAVRADGSLMWKSCVGGGNADAGVADLNLDGYPDVIFPNDAGQVNAFNGRTGGWLWSVNLRDRYNLRSGSIPVGPGIGQLDGVGGPDVVVGARDSHDPENFSNNHALLAAISSTGTILWAKQDLQGAPLTYTHPVVVDAAKDGTNEVYWADWNTIGHKGGIAPEDSWAVTGPAHFYRYDNKGNMVWRQTMSTWWQNKDVPIADVDGDGVQEMLANGPGPNAHDGIWYLDTRTGAKETFVDAYPWKVARAPVVADLWGTGTMQWVMEVGPADSSAGGPGILVYDTHQPYNSAWPHLPYPSAGTGTTPPPPPPPPPPTGTFAATFSGVRGNEWWVQANVAATGETLSKVDMRLNGGTWQPLGKQSWGGWAASMRIVQGTSVQLRATSTAGSTVLSDCYGWIPPSNQDASKVTCGSTPPPPPPPPSGNFSATFTVSSNVNNWWVEVTVKASGGTLATVDARVNSGAWVGLSKTDWGTWAKSMQVPSGSQVTFRATSTTGETATSAPTTWK